MATAPGTMRPGIMRLEHVLRWVSSAGLAVAMTMLVLMTILIALQVACRNLLDMGLPWVDELARFAGLWVVYLTVPHLLLEGRHIAVNMLMGLFGGRARKLLHVLNEICVIGFCVLLLVGLQTFLERAATFSTPAIGMPNWVFYLPMTIGMGLLTLVAIFRLVRALRGA
ncbi:TRAP transporter small permease [Rhodospirillaceae bacterium SYSU D60014]|uniref:TRAP transporter small permease n=1 Tax=Virgifigura deserti TaxID=2268457 RepID=UPI000E66130A